MSKSLNRDEVYKIYEERFKNLHSFFISNNISYYAIDSTLLGAVRNKGFLSLEDEINIALKRDEYNKFLKHADKLDKDLFKVINYKVCKDVEDSITKICLKNVIKKNTFYRRKIDNSFHINVFPMDNPPLNESDLNKIIKKRDFLNKILFYKNKDIRNSPFLRKILFALAKFVFSPFSCKYIAKKIDDLVSNNKFQKNKNFLWVSNGIYSFDKEFHKDSYFGKPSILKFESSDICVPQNYHQVLVNTYGTNYMVSNDIIDRAIVGELTEEMPKKQPTIPENRKSWIGIAIFVAFILSSIIGSNFLFAQTSIYKLDNLANSLNNYNEHDYYKGYYPSLVRLTKKDFSDDYMMNAYSEIETFLAKNKYTQNVYQVISTETTASDYDISIISQKTFSITKQIDSYGGYTLDGNGYTTYFGYDTIDRTTMISPRFNCSGFVFITDTFADKLLEKYKLSSYIDLITNEQYSVLDIFDKNNGSFVTRLSINNIIYGDKINAPQTNKLYGDFGVAYLGRKKDEQPNAVLSLDFQLKVDPYGSAKIFRELSKVGYSTDTCFYNVMIYNYSTNQYEQNQQFVNELPLALDSSKDILYFSFAMGIFIVLTCLIVLVIDNFLNKKEQEIVEIVLLLIFVIYGIIATFVRIPWIIGLLPFIAIVIYLLNFSIFLPKLIKKCNKEDKK